MATHRKNVKYTALKKRKRHVMMRRIRAVVLLLFVVAAVYGAVIGIGLARDVMPGRDTFQENVTVNGNSLAGYDFDGALAMLEEKYAQSLKVSVPLRWGDQEWMFTPTQVGASINVDEQVKAAWQYGKEGSVWERQDAIRALRECPVDLTVELRYDEAALDAYVQEIKSAIDCEPVDATMEVKGREDYVFTESSVGYRLDTEALKRMLEDVIRYGNSDPVQLNPEILEPEHTVESLSKTVTLLTKYTTPLKGSSSDRSDNVRQALSNFDGLRVRPGYSISFNDLVGKRTIYNGYKEAPEYDGSKVISGIGGGACQASTTIYGAVLCAGLEVTERYNHTMTVGYVGPSMDAAVNDEDTKDLTFRNNTTGILYFFTEVNKKKETATVWIYGTPIEEGVTIELVAEVIQRDIRSTGITYIDDEKAEQVWYTDQTVFYKEGKPGMRSRAYRVYKDASGNEIRRELLSEDYYAPEDAIYLRGVHER